MSTQVTKTLLQHVKRIEGKYISVDVYSLKSDGRKFIVGIIICPYTGKKFEFRVEPHLDQAVPGIVQHDGGFLEHMRKIEQYREWMYENIEPYSRNSFHKRKYFICKKCGFKTTRYIDILLHLVQIHKFLLK